MSDQDSPRRTDHDSPWKDALESYFQEFVQLLFPAIHGEVDWSRGYSPMDKELQQITADANSGRRHADKLIKVHARDGGETWVLVHVEVQGEPEDGFAQRMYTYQYRLRDRYGVDVVSLAVLADTSPGLLSFGVPHDQADRLGGALGGSGGQRECLRPGGDGTDQGQASG
ncbi:MULTISPECIES: hypothetical protein [unclassified Ectothiorhodospira]|uniref:hypothetical protein n=1 Tax=unclassified Ectothiorhodospira TaxID=2684909 RepID=UPI001EE8A2D0|nr:MULTISPECIES: hypothetical protein [unclassified Ectothiorhodospira]MCG5516509.1 hypothetical protein [Ectothiorhodospira sp. 9100]MCG5519292.1 hypothetical protein [Ectothiorhodospira sp. 9905]